MRIIIIIIIIVQHVTRWVWRGRRELGFQLCSLTDRYDDGTRITDNVT
jgi:hypothetical protein